MCSIPRRARTRPTDGETGAIHRAPRRGRVEGPVGPVGVEGHGQPKLASDGAQGGQDRVRGLRGPELGIQQPLRRVVHHGDERLALARARASHSGHCRRGAAARRSRRGARAGADAGRGRALGDEARRLEGKLHEGVRQGHTVIPPGDAVKMPDVEPAIARRGTGAGSAAPRRGEPCGARAAGAGNRAGPSRHPLIAGAPAPQAAWV